MANQNGTVTDVKSELKKTSSKLSSVVDDGSGDAKEIVDTAAGAASDVFDSALSTASTIAGQIADSALALLPVKNSDEAFELLETTVEDVRANLAEARDATVAFVKKHPVYSLLGAAAIGAVAIMWMNSREEKAPAKRRVKYDA